MLKARHSPLEDGRASYYLCGLYRAAVLVLILQMVNVINFSTTNLPTRGVDGTHPKIRIPSYVKVSLNLSKVKFENHLVYSSKANIELD